jgi:hypothetical protein
VSNLLPSYKLDVPILFAFGIGAKSSAFRTPPRWGRPWQTEQGRKNVALNLGVIFPAFYASSTILCRVQ